MFLSYNIWTAYGIKTAPEENFEMQTLSHLTERTSAPQPSLVVDTSSAPTSSTTSESPSDTNTTQAAITLTPAVPAAPPAHPTASHLSPAAIAGLCAGIGVVVVLVAYVVLEYCVLRKRRREKALRRAVEEVESASVRSEEIVMEDKNEIVVGEEEVWEVEVGRKGMSLPRRVW